MPFTFHGYTVNMGLLCAKGAVNYKGKPAYSGEMGG